jgi:hypothetical protein
MIQLASWIRCTVSAQHIPGGKNKRICGWDRVELHLYKDRTHSTEIFDE